MRRAKQESVRKILGRDDVDEFWAVTPMHRTQAECWPRYPAARNRQLIWQANQSLGKVEEHEVPNERERLEEGAALGVVSIFGGDWRHVKSEWKSTDPSRWGSRSARWPSSGSYDCPFTMTAWTSSSTGAISS